MRINVCLLISCAVLSLAPSGECLTQGTEQPSAARQAESGEARDPDLAAIRASAQAFVEAFNKGDAQAVASLWTENGDYIDDSGNRFTGRAAIEKVYSEFFAENANAKIQINIDSLQRLSKTTAVEEGTSLVEVPPSAAAIGQYLAIHVKVDGKWQMASVRDTLVETGVAQQNLADLDWLIGTWVAEEQGNKYESVCHWVSDHSFVQRDFTVTRFDGTQSSGVQLIGWNPQGGYVQSWTFSPGGGHAVGAWTPTEGGWAAQTQGMTGEGISTSSTNLLRRLDDNAYVWQSVDRTMGGVSYPDTDEVVLKRQTVTK